MEKFNGIDSRRPFKIELWLSKVLGCLAPILIPPIHIWVLYYFWKEHSYPVNDQTCKNSCWDTVFKGPYENGVSSYKHVYFNATGNFLKIWILTVSCIIALYECTRRLVSLALNRRLRFSMFVLFSGSIFSNYYSWWMYFNYWNDEYFNQWNHQLFFTVTELISSFVMLDLADKKRPVTSRKIFAIVGIALLHILTGSYDQFVNNVVFGKGEKHQVVRDFGFMVADIFNFILPVFELIRARTFNILDINSRMELFMSGLLLITAFVIYSLL